MQTSLYIPDTDKAILEKAQEALGTKNLSATVTAALKFVVAHKYGYELKDGNKSVRVIGKELAQIQPGVTLDGKYRAFITNSGKVVVSFEGPDPDGKPRSLVHCYESVNHFKIFGGSHMPPIVHKHIKLAIMEEDLIEIID